MMKQSYVKHLFTVLMLLSWAGITSALTTQSINFAVDPPTPGPASKSDFKYVSGGIRTAVPGHQSGYFAGTGKASIICTLKLSEAIDVNLAVKAQTLELPLDIEVNDEPLVIDYATQKPGSVVTLFRIPKAMFKKGKNQDNTIQFIGGKFKGTLETPALFHATVSEANIGLDLANPAPPNTTPAAQPDWDYFAWNTFVAMNWPAANPDPATGKKRGFPDVTNSFIKATHDTVTVWETFKEKREVFNGTIPDKRTKATPNAHPNPATLWNTKVNYGTLRVAGEQVSDAPTRTMHQGAKMMFDAFDETVEVSSEALEGSPNKGDSDYNPIYGKPVGPRVWKGQPTKKNSQPVVYEVKVNYDFFDYVVTNNLYQANRTAPAPASGTVKLPFRTSADAPPLNAGVPGGQTGTTKYRASDVTKKYKAPPAGSVPPKIGAVHLKAAWIELNGEDPTKYHTAMAQYYTSDAGGNPVASKPKLFGLVGLHIIQRIHTGKPGDAHAGATGGTFIFATWEHVDVDPAIIKEKNKARACRRIATRYEKLAEMFIAFIHLVSVYVFLS